MICCSYMLKCQVLFRLCTGMKRKQKKEQQKVVSGMSPFYHRDRCSSGTEPGSLPLSAHSSIQLPAKEKGLCPWCLGASSLRCLQAGLIQALLALPPPPPKPLSPPVTVATCRAMAPHSRVSGKAKYSTTCTRY